MHGHNCDGMSEELFHRNDIHSPFPQTRCKIVPSWTPQQADLPTTLRSAQEWYACHPQGYARK